MRMKIREMMQKNKLFLKKENNIFLTSRAFSAFFFFFFESGREKRLIGIFI